MIPIKKIKRGKEEGKLCPPHQPHFLSLLLVISLRRSGHLSITTASGRKKSGNGDRASEGLIGGFGVLELIQQLCF